ncbi:MAG: hypothetical protein AMXMBFR82_27350 [Candidatus Hydrogenedentota bacterium]
MFMMYVDESGDCGITNSPSRYFALSGLVVHELRWHDTLDQLIAFKRTLRDRFDLPMRTEFHAAAFISRPGKLTVIPKHDRLTMIRHFADCLASIPDIAVVNVIVDKEGRSDDFDVFERAWTVLIQRFENTMSHRNFPGPCNADDRGILFVDRTDDKKLTRLLRRMRRYNPIPSKIEYRAAGADAYRNLLLTRVVEDPTFRDSAHSFFIQAVDLTAFLLYQKFAPSAYIKKKSAHNYFNRLDPILCTVAAGRDPQGIVRL